MIKRIFLPLKIIEILSGGRDSRKISDDKIRLVNQCESSMNLAVYLSENRLMIERKRFVIQLLLPTRWVAHRIDFGKDELWEGRFEFYIFTKLFVVFVSFLLVVMICVNESNFSGVVISYIMIRCWSGILMLADFTNVPWEKSIIDIMEYKLLKKCGNQQ